MPTRRDAAPSKSRKRAPEKTPRGKSRRSAPVVHKAGQVSSRPKSIPAKPAIRVTEQANPATADIDQLDSLAVVDRINAEDAGIARAVHKERKSIARVVDRVVDAFRSGGRLFYVGAGTSGRLGVLDASECPPTFSTSPHLVQGIIAGGKRALHSSIEGAEDDPDRAAEELRGRGLMREDVVVAIAASGSTPFALGALIEARLTGAASVLVTCNADAELRSMADITVAPVVGPEVIAGSTRMKAGTATKLVLNTITTAAMIRWGKVYGNRMVDLKPACAKLVKRARNLISDLADVDFKEASRLLDKSGNRVKVAILMSRKTCTPKQALALLARSGGMLRAALEEEPDNNKEESQ